MRNMFGDSSPPDRYDERRRRTRAADVDDATRLAAGARRRAGAGHRGWGNDLSPGDVAKKNALQNAREKASPKRQLPLPELEKRRDLLQAARALKAIEQGRRQPQPSKNAPGRPPAPAKFLGGRKPQVTASGAVPLSAAEQRTAQALAAAKTERKTAQVRFQDDWRPGKMLPPVKPEWAQNPKSRKKK